MIQLSSIILPPTLYSSDIVIRCELLGHKTWHFAGYVKQVIAVPNIGDCVFFRSSKIFFNQPTLFKFEPFLQGYKIQMEKADWAKSLSIKIYEGT